MTIMGGLVANERHDLQPEQRGTLGRWADRNSWAVFIALNLAFWLCVAALFALA
ncbi:hypothetical protein FHS83_003757 [Rhizomicrobium palustre]|uniref:Uncharacterized protein n=1 Tax=Rhizomicrobium palustre TaxID=189966 RepID=A0A846N4J3_9PROT|nr:hypothetical protein [Rhizomicrobium palustre]